MFQRHASTHLDSTKKVLKITKEMKGPPPPDPLDLENWYEALKEFTFATTFLPLSNSELELICNVHDKKNEISDLNGLKLRVAPLLGPDGAFVKLSTRSCKDWCLGKDRTTRIFKQEQENLALSHPLESDDVRDVIAIIRSMSFALRVSTGKPGNS
jgi:hypothetical protein